MGGIKVFPLFVCLFVCLFVHWCSSQVITFLPFISFKAYVRRLHRSHPEAAGSPNELRLNTVILSVRRSVFSYDSSLTLRSGLLVAFAAIRRKTHRLNSRPHGWRNEGDLESLMAEMENTSIRNDSATLEITWHQRWKHRSSTSSGCYITRSNPFHVAKMARKTNYRRAFHTKYSTRNNVWTMRMSFFYRCPVSTAFHMLHKNCYKEAFLVYPSPSPTQLHDRVTR